jgi:catechol 2,3-dioxygenase-like lactoylglutathione lyase family enzyme
MIEERDSVMKATYHHLQVNVSNRNVSYAFYKKFSGYLGFEITWESSEYLCFSDGKTELWLIPTDARFLRTKFHRKNTGLNHLSFRVKTKKDVDTFFKEFLQKNKIATLYESPKAFPEYTDKYYAVYFEDPDRIKLEVMFM